MAGTCRPRAWAGDSRSHATWPGWSWPPLASLSLGAVIGPEAPLIALGGGLALLAADRTKLGADAQGRALIAAAGSAAAIATILGNPLVAVILMLEIVGLASRSVMLVIVPCIVSSGVGALLFTGLGHWTGLPTGTLALPDISATTLDAADLLLVIPLAAAVALLMHVVMVLGRRVATAAAPRPILVAVAAGVLTGALAGLFALVTGRSPVEVLESGQQSLPGLVDQTWPVGVLLLLLLCKGVAYGLCLGSFRGGPTFPAIFLGGVVGVLAGHLPGLGTVPGLGICMAAGMVAILRLPVTSVLLIVLLLGPAATSQMPVVMIATVTALVVVETLDRRRAPTGDAHPAATGPTSQARHRDRLRSGLGETGQRPPGAGPATPDVEDLDGAPRPVRARPRAAGPPDLPGLQRHDAGGPVGARGAAARAGARLRQPVLGARLR